MSPRQPQQPAPAAAEAGRGQPAAVRLVLPWGPSANAYWRSIVVGRAVRVLVSEAGHSYRGRVLDAVREQRPPHWPAGVRLSVEVTVCPPDRRRRDLDNIFKVPGDALTAAGVWADDSQIDRLLLVRGEVQRGGHLDLLVEVLP